jgi:pilus assembly protein Flp/PilA
MTEIFINAYLAVHGAFDSLVERTRSERGASMVEYALLVGLIAIVAIIAITFLGKGISGLFNSAGNTVNSVNAP